MANQQTISGDWNRVKGKLREQWGEITEDELDQVHGNAEQLIGLLQRKTGKSREAIEDYLESTFEHESWYQATKHTIERYGQATAGAVGSSASYSARQLRSGYTQSNQMVREHPAGSLAACFAAGLVTGVMVAVLLRSLD